MSIAWKKPYQCTHLFSDPVRQWLMYSGSMTLRMHAHCHTVTIEVLSQTRRRISLRDWQDQSPALRSFALVREVVMHCDNEPWLYARTIIPCSVLVGNVRRLLHLDSKPIGPFLTKELHLHRQGFLISPLGMRLVADEFGYSTACDLKTEVVARQSYFVGLRQKIQLTEVFLPAMMRRIEVSKGGVVV